MALPSWLRSLRSHFGLTQVERACRKLARKGLAARKPALERLEDRTLLSVAGFGAAVNYAAGLGPRSVAVGDFNSDGQADLAVANSAAGGNISVLLGNGNGSFQTAVSYAAGSTPVSAAVGDFNSDGKQDLVTANANGSNVSVLLGNGNGSFQAPVNSAAGTTPNSVTVGDFNGDGKLDVATANYNGGNVSVLLGNGNGTFQAPANLAVGSQPYALSMGDFNRDGKLDLAVVNAGSASVSVLQGNGNGTFQAAVSYAVGSGPASVAAGDFNRDGVSDLAVANFDNGNVSVLLGTTSGTFQAAVNYSVGTGTLSVSVGDLDRDGRLDLAVANYTSNNVSVLAGNGDGTFQAAVSFATGTNPFAVATGDFNRDGRDDLAVANEGTNNVSVLLNNTIIASGGTFQPAVNFTASSNPSSIAAGDFNRDGKEDLVTANEGSQNVSVFLGNGNGTFQSAVNYSVGTGGRAFVTVGDLNRDGKSDLVVANDFSTTIRVFLGNGDGTFQAPVTYAAGGQGFSIAVGDFNRDGKPDLASANRRSHNVGILLGNGNGTFQAPVTYAVGTEPFNVAVGDFNGDGKADLTTPNFNSHTLSVLLGNGDGTFQTAANYAAGTHPIWVTVGDFNRDGKADLARTASSEGANDVRILLGNGDGTFQTPVSYAVGTNPFTVAVSDLNRDGKSDLAVPNNASANLSVLLGNGDGTFQPRVNYAVSLGSRAVAVGDFNRDGLADLATANFDSNNVSVLLNGDICTTSPAGVVSWWHADGNANDSEDGNHGTLRNGTTFASGQFGQAFSFDGVNDYVEIPASPNLHLGTSDFTINAWIKTTSANDGYLFAKRSSSDGIDIFVSAATGKIRVALGQPPVVEGTTVVTDGQFHHVAVTRRVATGTVSIFVDGVLEASGTGFISSFPDSIARIGAFTNTSVLQYPFQGLIDEVQVYNRALTAAEIAAIFACANSPPTANAGGPYTVAEGGSVALNGSGSSDPNQPAGTLTYAWDLDGDNMFGETGAGALRGNETGINPAFSAAGLDGPGSATVALRVTDNGGLSSTATATITITNVAPTLTITGANSVNEGATYILNLSSSDPGLDTISSWTINWGDGMTQMVPGNPSSVSHTYADGPNTYTITATATDEDGTFAPESAQLAGIVHRWRAEGNANDSVGTSHGTLQNGATFAPGVAGQAFSLDGVNDHVSLAPPISTAATSLTIEGCVRATTFNPPAPHNRVTVMGADEGSAVFIFGIYPDGRVNLQVRDGSENNALAIGSTALAVGTWYHVAAVWNQAARSATVYVNGVPGATVTNVSINPATLPSLRAIGVTTRGGSPFEDYFSGQIDDLSIYNRALSTAELQGLCGSVPVTVNNVAPTAALSNSGPVGEGSTATVSFSGQFDPSPADITAGLRYSYDFDNNGTFEVGNGTYAGSSTSASATVPASFLADGPGSRTVRARVIDKDGGVNNYTTSITINNVNPTASIAGPTSGVRGQQLTFSLTATDPSLPDRTAGFIYNITWGDGSPVQTILRTANNGSGPSAPVVDHVFTASGTYTVQVTATDKDNGTSTAATLTITITAATLQTDPCDATKTALVVGGTTGSDILMINPGGPGEVQVLLNSVLLGNFTPTGRIIVFAQAGNDDIQVAGGVTLPAWLYGDDGDDRLRGGAGNDVLLGGAGNDDLDGAQGRDLQIGGLGADLLTGQADEDIIIAGTTAHDNSQAALCAIVAEWTSGRDYAARVANLRGDSMNPAFGSRANGNVFLQVEGAMRTVFDDGVADTLTGAGGQDWFFANTDLGVLDILTGLGGSEQVDDLD